MDKCPTCGGDLVDQKCPVCDAGDNAPEEQGTEGDGGANVPTEDEPASA